MTLDDAVLPGRIGNVVLVLDPLICAVGGELVAVVVAQDAKLPPAAIAWTCLMASPVLAWAMRSIAHMKRVALSTTKMKADLQALQHDGTAQVPMDELEWVLCAVLRHLWLYFKGAA